MLDKLGYAKKDAQGFRLRPDGQKVFFAIDVIPTLYPDAVDTLELVKRHWADIGVDMKVNTIERALYYTRGDNNDHDAAVWPGPGGLDPMLDPRDFFAQHTAGLALRDPVDAVVRLRRQGRAGAARKPEAAHEAVRRGPRDRRSRQARRDHEAALRSHGRCVRDDRRLPRRQRLRHRARTTCRTCRRSMPNSWSWPNPGPALPQQFFFTT